ncbi:hypothetical protein [Aerococcus vaginalis]
MATIDEIKNNVLAKVRDEEEEKAKQEKEKIKAKIDEQLEQIASESDGRNARLKKQDEQAEKNRQQQIQKAQRSKELEMQDRLMQDIFQEALHELNGLSADDLFELVKRALNSAPERATELVLGANNEQQLTEEQLQSLKAEHSELTISEATVKNAGGFILSQDAVDYNYTFKALLAEVENSLSATFIKWAEDEEE